MNVDVKVGAVNRLPLDAIRDFCQRQQISEFAVFGSILRPDFRSDSDVDVLVTFRPGVRVSLMGLVTLADELETILGRSVDLHERVGVEEDRNYLRRNSILGSAEVVYAE
jgi:uncharacterized protein